jgi:hypothetical protein
MKSLNLGEGGDHKAVKMDFVSSSLTIYFQAANAAAENKTKVTETLK